MWGRQAAKGSPLLHIQTLTLEFRQLDGFEPLTLRHSGHDGAMSTQTELSWAGPLTPTSAPSRT
jgi:hypothetical protein